MTSRQNWLVRFLHTKAFWFLCAVVLLAATAVAFVPRLRSSLKPTPPAPVVPVFSRCAESEQVPGYVCYQMPITVKGGWYLSLLYLGPNGFYDIVVEGCDAQEALVLQRYPNRSVSRFPKDEARAVLNLLCSGSGLSDSDAVVFKGVCGDAHNNINTKSLEPKAPLVMQETEKEPEKPKKKRRKRRRR